jgi:L-arabinose isomerase
MKETEKARVGLLGLMLELYDLYPDLKPKMARFAQELVEKLSPFAEVDFPGVCNTRDQVSQAVQAFEQAGCDLLIVVLLTYAPSHIALPALLQTSLPVLILNTQRLAAVTQDTRSQDTTENHGMHGVQDLGNVLLRSGRSYHMVTGHYQDDDVLRQVQEWCDAARMVRFVRNMRIGLMGYPMEGMGDFGLDHTALLAQTGIEIHQIAMKSVAERAKAAPAEEIEHQMEQDRRRFQIDASITPVEHEASSRIEWAMRQVLVEQGLHGFAAHFMAVSQEGWLDTLPFLAASKLLGEGYGFGGEGDVTSAAAVLMLRALAGAANFTEMFTMDPAGNAVLMMHMGEGNWRMARADQPVHMLRSKLGLVDLRVDPLLLAFSLEPGAVTLLSLTTLADGKLRFIVTEGEVVDFPYVQDLGRPHFKFRPNCDLGVFLTHYTMAGGSHHQGLAYGHWAGTIAKAAAILGIECACV